MACFTVPLAAAAAAGVAKHAAGKGRRTSLAEKFRWLVDMMLGGSFLLAIEHVWHGEVTWRFPFLTAVSEGPDAVSEMLHEMATRGVAMAVVVFAVWGCMVAVSAVLERKAAANV
jgi:hypothetical protein